MEIVIIEDEQLMADDLTGSIIKLMPDARITAKLASVKEAVKWFEKNKQPDMIFSDIQLGDGLSFEIFNMLSITVPVVFCTAYDEYALNAFKANGIDYILKPFGEEDLLKAFEKYKNFEKKFSGDASLPMERVLQLFNTRDSHAKASVLVYQRDKILPIRTEHIALFYVENEMIHLITFDGHTYTVNKTLEELEKMTTPDFYRATRQHLISRKAIREVSLYFARKLSVTLTIPFKDKILVNKTKTTDFLNWLSEN